MAANDRKAAFMKFIIFTPIVMASAIARMSQLIIKALNQQFHEIIIIRTEEVQYFSTESYNFGPEIIIIEWNNHSRVENALLQADSIIYQIADNYNFHGGCLKWLPAFPGIVCLHDNFVGNLFSKWSLQNHSEALKILEVWYGKSAAENFFSYKNMEDFIKNNVETAPLLEWIASMAAGVITHSQWGVKRILESCAGPVHITPLAYNINNISEQRLSKHTKKLSEHKIFTILVIGQVNFNKCYKTIIKAISKSALLRSKVCFNIVGLITEDEKKNLNILAENLKVNILITGAVNDYDLHNAILRADIICCLRNPILESASASAIEALLYGKTVIVMDHGFYSEIPDACVCKISLKNEIQNLTKSLEFLYSQPKERKRIGDNAAKWAARTFCADNYACQIINISLNIAKAEPWTNAYKFFTDTLLRWNAAPEEYTNSFTLVSLESMSK